MEHTANALTRIMASKGVSKKELIRRTGLAEATITKLMRKDMVGNLYTWNQVTKALGITINDILGVEDE